ncbi:carbohydrate porin [Bradyrhizobium manausense]|uniref:carbohydrate porin n=1 Tax=Bradyrhizobium TaxID=374 RepID=UPI001BA4D4D0|nr:MULTISPECIES: carbohydrate porin [Bradyrhizobium]MBR0826573.1 carbohydrate porin [Bradyrhizobium manausense]UVO33569.1 carbohydrate porin [Bradyrhizobium arachidis]
MLAVNEAAPAADLPLKTPAWKAVYDWTGFYIGAHAGYGRGSSNFVLSDPAAITGNGVFSGMIGGVQAGYNYRLNSGLLVGVEGDFSFPNYIISNSIVSALASGANDVTQQWDYTASLRGRVGYTSGPWLLYATGGFAWMGERYFNTPAVGVDPKILNTRPGWIAGGGVEYAFAPHWSARLEYLYSRFDAANVTFASGAQYTSSALDFQSIRLGLNRKVDWPGMPSYNPKSSLIDTESDRWEIHGQSTYLPQGYGSFRALYTGPNSLSPSAQAKATWSNSLFLNARLWEGGEVYYNPELLQGFGLNDTVGAAGFPNGEAQKSNFPYPHYNTSRLFLRQTFGFGGEQEELASGQLQLGQKVDVSRLTIQAGKFPVIDVFDGNAYAKDTRKDFMNWSLWAPGAFDYSADKVGLTYGVTAELNQKNWALRGGYFLMVAESNSNHFDTRVPERGQYLIELETRFSLFSQPGKLRTIGWVDSANMGSFRETLDNPALNLDISQTRRGRLKYGYVLNLEQAITDDVGLFSRWSWNDGHTETLAFTDIHRSLSAGLSIKGTKWGRPDDVIGIGGAVNAISQDYRDFLAAGGLGVLVGDGALNYRKERILEAYYAYALNKSFTFTADYQLITNPAYNADRGPVSIFSGRLHGEF